MPCYVAKLIRSLNPTRVLPLPEAIEATVPAFGRAFASGEPQHYMQAFLDAKARHAEGKSNKPKS